MYRKLFLVFFMLFNFSLFAADFEITVGNIGSDYAVIYIPRTGSAGNMFAIYLDGKQTFITNSRNSKIDANTITTTVKWDAYNTDNIQHFIYAIELNTNTRTSNTVTITAKPKIQEILDNRDANAYINNKMIFQAWSKNVSPTVDIINTTLSSYAVFLTEIVVGGTSAGSVAVMIDDTPIRYYHYGANGTSGQIFSTKVLIQRNQRLRVQLIDGGTGTHTVSITGEIVK